MVCVGVLMESCPCEAREAEAESRAAQLKRFSVRLSYCKRSDPRGQWWVHRQFLEDYCPKGQVGPDRKKRPHPRSGMAAASRTKLSSSQPVHSLTHGLEAPSIKPA